MIKRIPKILKLVFVLIFLFQMIGLAILFAWPAITQAADVNFKPQITIPGFDTEAKTAGMSYDATKGYKINGSSIGVLIKSIYKYAIGIVGILAAIVLMIGGFMWLMAAGNPSKISEAQEWIKAALTGLILALGSYLILATINPALTTFKPLDIKPAAELGCCQDTSATCSAKSKTDCKGSWKSGYICGSNGKCSANIGCSTGYIACQIGEVGCIKTGKDAFGRDFYCKKNNSRPITIPTQQSSQAPMSPCLNINSTNECNNNPSCTWSNGTCRAR